MTKLHISTDEDFEKMKPRKREIFVFGSNLAGRHGKGAALYAKRHHGAIYGQGEGLQGDSYAIPTKDENLKTLSLEAIAYKAGYFLGFASNHPELTFNVTPIGCGLAGYKPEDIAWMFGRVRLPNVLLPKEFLDVLEKED